MKGVTTMAAKQVVRKKRGLGSSNIDEKTKHRIQSMGGKASHGGGRKPLNRE
jgi:hypothetical protein